MVLASPPVVSLSRFAARPVGAVKVMRLPCALKRRIMPTTVVVFTGAGATSEDHGAWSVIAV